MVLQIPTGFLVSRRTQDTARYKDYFEYEALTSLWLTFPCHSSIIFKSTLQSYNPEEQTLRFALLPFRSPLLRQSLLLSLPAAT